MKHARLNNPESCIACARRSDGFAIGYPKRGKVPSRLGWYCNECGPVTAWKAFYMVPENMDREEQATCLAIANDLCPEGTPLEVPANELPAFLAWVVKEFANVMRERLHGQP